jgi:hypothetical protein
MFFENKSHKSNIACMLCKNFFAKDENELIRHILRMHPVEAHYLKMLNWKKMII